MQWELFFRLGRPLSNGIELSAGMRSPQVTCVPTVTFHVTEHHALALAYAGNCKSAIFPAA